MTAQQDAENSGTRTGRGGGNDQGQGIKPSSGAEQLPGPGDPIDELVDWQMGNAPMADGWSCPDCGMNWTEPPTRCPCGVPEPGQPNAAIIELAFWEAVTRCVRDENSPITLVPLAPGEKGGINFGNRIPDELWQHMAAALQELRAAAGV